MDPGPRTRLEQLADACAARAWRLAYGLLGNAEDAWDAVQQAFLVAARKSDLVPEDDPWPWFSVVLVHEAKNLRRKRRRRAGGSGPGGGEESVDRPDPGSPEPREAAERAEDAARLWRAIGDLPPPEREAVVLTHVGGMTHAVAAEALGLPRQTVSDRARRGLEALAVHLRRDPAAAARALAVVPALEPVGGLAQATATWTQTALASAGAATSAATAVGATATVTAGGSLMATTKVAWAFGVLAAAGVGFLGGGATGGLGLFPGGSREAAGPAAEGTLPAAAPSAAEGGRPTLEGALQDPGDASADGERLRAENARLAARLAEIEREVVALKTTGASEGPPGADGKGPTFTFGEGGKLAAVQEANWGELSAASREVTAALREALALTEAGKPVPRSVSLRVQENVERVRKYEYRALDQLPTSARHNGELTHPISVTNLMAGEVALGGHPFTLEQVAAIEALGLAFEQEFERLRQGWRPGDLRARRMLDEYRLKGRFTDDLRGILGEEQRALVADPSVRGIAGIDLYDPTLMILHTSPVLVGPDVATVRTKLLRVLAQKLGLAEGPAPAALDAAVDRFLDGTRSVQDPVPEARARHYTYAQGLVVGEASVALLERCLRDLEIPAEKHTALLDDPTWYVPRIVRP